MTHYAQVVNAEIKRLSQRMLDIESTLPGAPETLKRLLFREKLVNQEGLNQLYAILQVTVARQTIATTAKTIGGAQRRDCRGESDSGVGTVSDKQTPAGESQQQAPKTKARSRTKKKRRASTTNELALPAVVPFDALGVAFSLSAIDLDVVLKVGATPGLFQDALVASHDLWNGTLADHRWILSDATLCLLKRVLEYDPDRAVKLGKVQGGAKIALLSSLGVKHLDIEQSVDCASIATMVGLEHLRHTEVTNADARLLSALVSLKRVEISHTFDLSERGVGALTNFALLRHLDLTGSRAFADSGLLSVSALVELQRLSVRDCLNITDMGLGSITKLSKLERLDFGGCNNVTDKGLASIAECRRLQRLDVSDCNQITDAGLRALASLVELWFLDISACWAIQDVSALSALPKLTHLVTKRPFISRCFWDRPLNGDLSEPFFVSLTLLRKLEHVELGNSQIADVGMRSLSELPALKYIKVMDCEAITDESLTSLSSVRSLTHIIVGNGASITDAGVALLKNLPALQHLGLVNCGEVTDASIESLTALTTLRHLDVTLCNITDAGAASISKMTQLTHLNLSYCDMVTDAGTIALSESLAALEHIELKGCKFITDASLEALSKLVTLTHVGVNINYKESHLTSEGIEMLSSLVLLKTLDLGGTAEGGPIPKEKKFRLKSRILVRAADRVKPPSVQLFSDLLQ